MEWWQMLWKSSESSIVSSANVGMSRFTMASEICTMRGGTVFLARRVSKSPSTGLCMPSVLPTAFFSADTTSTRICISGQWS